MIESGLRSENTYPTVTSFVPNKNLTAKSEHNYVIKSRSPNKLVYPFTLFSIFPNK